MTNDLSSSDAIDLDADPSMIAKAQQQFPHLQFIQSDVCEFDLEEPVDVIFNNAALHWVGNENNAAERAVVCMARALKPGGRFVVEFGAKGNVKTGGPASIANIGLSVVLSKHWRVYHSLGETWN
jgi:trans-aconitate 2-methyltransferase